MHKQTDSVEGGVLGGLEFNRLTYHIKSVLQFRKTYAYVRSSLIPAMADARAINSPPRSWVGPPSLRRSTNTNQGHSVDTSSTRLYYKNYTFLYRKREVNKTDAKECLIISVTRRSRVT